MKSYEKIARFLRTDKDVIRVIEEKLSRSTGKLGVIDKIVEENEGIIKNRLDHLGLSRQASAKEIYDALINKIEADNYKIYEVLGRPKIETIEGCDKVLVAAKSLAKKETGFFLKLKKAEQFLRKAPPQRIISQLGYDNVNELLKNEDLFEVWSALRFMEDADWLNNIFFKQYEKLKPGDFEEREIIAKTLSMKWVAAAQSFVRKKYHNISHLKELGIVFVIPTLLGIPGELIRTLSLILHYLNEVPFYSGIVRRFSKDESTFAKNLISILRGDVLDRRLPYSSKSNWMVVQRYLAKDDENDWRLREPHVSPEALHWERAERMLVKLGEKFNHFGIDLAFWQNLNWVGDFFKTDTGVEILVSFNLVDTAMSLVKEKALVKYLYHHQESLWNKIFAEYFGEEKMEELIKENIIKGWFSV